MSESQKMYGKVVLITGATDGIGKAIATGLAALGATTVIVGRDRARGEAAVNEIKCKNGNDRGKLILADLSSQQEIRRVVREFSEQYGRLDVLINNVGASYGQRKETADGIEAMLALNHLCPFLLTNLLVPLLKSGAPSRIINMSSEGHRRAVEGIDFDDLQALNWRRPFPVYCRTKLANLLFTYEMARRLAGTRVTVNAVHPGMVETQLVRRFVAERCFSNSAIFSKAVAYVGTKIAKSIWKFNDLETAAAPAIFMASSDEIEYVTGKYFSLDNRITDSSPASYDENAARRLWQVSTALTGLEETAVTQVTPSETVLPRFKPQR